MYTYIYIYIYIYIYKHEGHEQVPLLHLLRPRRGGRDAPPIVFISFRVFIVTFLFSCSFPLFSFNIIFDYWIRPRRGGRDNPPGEPRGLGMYIYIYITYV